MGNPQGIPSTILEQSTQFVVKYPDGSSDYVRGDTISTGNGEVLIFKCEGKNRELVAVITGYKSIIRIG